MTNNPTIDGVSRKTIERIADHCKFWKDHAYIEAIGDIEPELRALLDAPVVERQPDDDYDQIEKAISDILDGRQLTAISTLRGLLEVWSSAPKPLMVTFADHKKGRDAYLEQIAALQSTNKRLTETIQHMIDQTIPLVPDENNPMWARRITIDELQSTIAQLQARVAELESGKVEILADGIQTLERIGASIDARQQRIDALTAPPAPAATLWEIRMPDEPGNPESPCEYAYVNSIAERDLLLQRDGSLVYAEYACLDATAALNEARK
jgi:hypothetical protein